MLESQMAQVREELGSLSGGKGHLDGWLFSC
jgi:hypothetical protein